MDLIKSKDLGYFSNISALEATPEIKNLLNHSRLFR